MTKKQTFSEVLKSIRGDYTPEQLARYRAHRASKDRAVKYFTRLYGQKASWVIVANVMAEYTWKFRRSASTFEKAWQALGRQQTSEIIFRAVNGLPCAEKDCVELAALLEKEN